jgi:predicted Zn-dependent protease
MAETNLRAYISEIEDLIEHNQLDEAIAHCRHILSLYPKHVEAYRMLGKALLEQGRHSDAADIFQRVHSVAPDDFVAHVGMAIIREDETNLDGAIWHMERAFEAQPANAVIQEELRRLYGRRDGLEPPKIHYTRGALARTYFKGGLYPQAIAELQGGLADEPDRLDLRVLYADVLWRNNQKQEAAEACSAILQKLPYCRLANHIMANLLRASGQMDQYRYYQERVEAVDPYEAFADASADGDGAAAVPAQAVRVQKFQWSPQAEGPRAGSGPEWMSALGIALEEPKPAAGVPDWMSEPAEPAAQPDTAGADWLADLTAPETVEEPSLGDSGWLRAIRSEVDLAPPAAPAQEHEPEWLTGSEAVAPAPSEQPVGPDTDLHFHEGLPDWLTAGEPAQAAQPASPTPLPDWLRSDEPAPATSLDNLPDWIHVSDLQPPAAAVPAQPAPAAPAESEEPEWFQPEPGLASGSELPAWLVESQPGSTPPVGTWPAASEPAEHPAEEPAPEAPAPPWLQPAPGLAADLPDWLRAAEPAEPEPAAPSDVAPAELPDWIKALAPQALADAPPDAEAPPPAEEFVPFLQENQPGASDTIAAWLKDRPPATEPAPLPAAPPPESVPDWLRDLLPDEEPRAPAKAGDWLADLAQPPEAQTGTPPATTPFAPGVPAFHQPPAAPPLVETGELAPVSEPEEPAQEFQLEVSTAAEAAGEPPKLGVESDTLAWLESLAAKHGAAEEEPAPETPARPSDMPDWLRDALARQPAEADEEPEPDMASDEALRDLLQAVEATPPSASVAPAEAATEDEALAWLEALAASHSAADSASDPAAQPAEDLPDWRQASKGDQPQAAGAAPERDVPSPAELGGAEDEALAWLEALAAKHMGPGEATPEPAAAPAEELPAWLNEAAQPTAEAEPAGEMPNWLMATRLIGEREADVPAPPAEEVEPAVPETLQPSGLPASEAGAETPPATEYSAAPETASLEPAETDDALAWLEALAAKHGASEAELVTPAEARSEEMPAWMRETVERPRQAEEVPDWLLATRLLGQEPPAEAPAAAEQLSEAADVPPATQELPAEALEPPAAEAPAGWPATLATEPAPEEPQAVAAELPDWLKPPEEFSAELALAEGAGDDAMAWLEALAAQQGAPPEELVTPLETRTEAMPDWLRQTVTPAEVEPPVSASQPESGHEPAAAMPDEAAAEPEGDDALAWLEALAAQHGARDEELITPAVDRAEDMPAWLQAAMSAPEPAEAELPAPEPASPAEPLPAWLAEAAAPDVEPLEFTPVVEAAEPEVSASPPEPAAPPEDLPVAVAETKPPEPVQPSPVQAVPAFSAAPAGRRRRLVRPGESGRVEPTAVRLANARAALQAGQQDEALAAYEALILDRQELDGVVADLEAAAAQAASRRALRALGDAYMRQDRLQKALETYKQAMSLR